MIVFKTGEILMIHQYNLDATAVAVCDITYKELQCRIR
jgi:hypothetical protein